MLLLVETLTQLLPAPLSLSTPVLAQLLADVAPVLFLPLQTGRCCCPGQEQGHWRPGPQPLSGCLRPVAQVPAGRRLEVDLGEG